MELPPSFRRSSALVDPVRAPRKCTLGFGVSGFLTAPERLAAGLAAPLRTGDAGLRCAAAFPFSGAGAACSGFLCGREAWSRWLSAALDLPFIMPLLEFCGRKTATIRFFFGAAS
jgi:hypothetical protein